MRITEPGIFTDMSEPDYRADPCPAPSLTQSTAKILLDRSPLHAWHGHPRLNPDHKPDNDTKFDIGNIAHSIVLGRGKEILVLDHDDWRTKAAKEARENAAKDGKLAVLRKHFMIAQAMARHAADACAAAGCPDAFDREGGKSEVVIAWKEGNVWCRSMIDWLSTSVPLVYDFKTTGKSAEPRGIGALMASAGWDLQAAFIERGLEVLKPELAGRYRFRFVAQEDEPPYATTVCELPESVITMGRKRFDMALETWQRCVETNRWPGYATEIVYPQYPSWAESQLLDREIEHADRQERASRREPMPDDILAAG